MTTDLLLAQSNQRERKLLNAFNEAALAIHKAHTHKAVFAALAVQFEQLGLHYGVINLNQAGDRLQLAYTSFDPAWLEQVKELLDTPLSDLEIEVAQLEARASLTLENRPVGYQDNVIADLAAFLRQPSLEQLLVHAGFPNRAIHAPLFQDERMKGMLIVVGNALERSDRPIINAFAHHLSVALAKADLLQARQRRVDELTWHREISTELRAVKETNEILQLIVNHLTKALGENASGSIMVFDRHMRVIRVRAIAGTRPHAHLRELPRPDGLSQLAMRRRDAAFSYDSDSPPLHPEAKADGVQIAMSIPLIDGKRVIGVIYADRCVGEQFSQDEVDAAQFFANQAVIALRDAHYVKQLLALTEIADQASSQQGVQTLLNLICERTAELLDADSSVILLKTEEERETVLCIKGHWGVTERTVKDTRDRLGTSIAGRVALTGEPIIANNIPEDDRFYNPAATEENFQAIVSVPIRSKNEIIGTLDIHSKTQTDVFTEHDLHILELMAGQAAVAMYNAELVERLEALFAVGTEMVATLDVDYSAVLQQVVQAIIDSLGYRVAYFRLIKPDGSLTIEASAGTTRDFTGNPDYILNPDQPSITHEVLRTGKPVQVFDVREDKRFAYPGMAHEEGLRGMLSVPLIFEGKVIAGLSCFTGEPHIFSAHEVKLVSAFANLATVAAENARRIRELQATRQIAEEIAPLLDQKEILQHVARRTAKLIGPSATVIVNVYDPISKAFQTREVVGPRRKQTLNEPPRPDGLTARSFRSNEAFVVDKAFENPAVKHSARLDQVESIAVVPIVGHQEEPLGVLYVDTVVDVYLRNRLPLLQIIASQTGVALERARLIKRMRQESELVLGVARATSTLSDLQATWREILSGAMGLTGAQYGSISRIEESRAVLRYVVTEGGPRADMRDELAINENSIQGWVALHKESVLVTNVKEDVLWKDVYRPSIPATLSELTVPIKRGGTSDLVGIINLESPYQSAFDEEDVRLLTLLAIQADIAIQNAQLYAGIKNHARQLQGVLDAGHHITALRPVRDVLQAITDSLHRNLDYDLVALYPYSEHKGEFEEFVMSGWLNTHLATMKKLENRGRARQWLTGPEYHFSSMSYQDSFMVGPFVEREHIVASGYVRLTIGLEIVGVLFVNCRNKHHFTDDEQNAVRLFANQAAIAIYNSRQFSTLQNHLDQLEMTLAASQGIVAQKPLRETLQEILNRLVESEGYDIVTLYPYDPLRDSFNYWLVAGQFRRYIEAAGRVRSEATVIRPVMASAQDEYFTLDSAIDPVLGGPFVTREGVKSSGFIKLKHGQQMVGLLFINRRQKREFTTEERQTLRRYAGLMAVALHDARLFHQGREQITMLARIGHEVNQSLDLEQVLNTLYEQLQNVFGKHVTPVVLLYDELKQELRFLYTDKFGFEIDVEKEKARQTIHLDEGICGWVAQYKQPANIPDVTAAPRYIEMRQSTRSELAVPILIGDRLVGILDIESPIPKQFTEDDERLLQTVANQVATAIANAEKYERRRKQLDAFHQSTKAVIESWGRRDTLQAILEEAARLTGATFATIQEKRADHLYFEAVYPAEARDALFARVGSSMPLSGKGITVAVAKTCAPCLDNDVQQSPIYRDGGFGSRSELAVPLFVEAEIWGVLNVEHPRPDAFDDEDLHVVRALGELAVVALHNVERANQLSRINTVALMGAWGADVLHDVTRETGAIRRAVFVLLQRPDLPERVRRRLEAIDQYAGFLVMPELPEQPVALGEVRRSRDSVFLDSFLRAELSIMREIHPSVEIICETGCPGQKVAIHRDWLLRLLRHLISNAVSATAGRAQRKVVVRSMVQGDGAEIQIEDSGEGVQPEIEPLLFEQPVPHEDGRLGRGLLLVRYLVEQHGGEARLLWNRLDEGACFAFSIPLADEIGTGNSARQEEMS